VSLPIEQWRPIPGYEDHYEASDLGRVRSLPRSASNGRALAGGVLRTHVNSHGYYSVVLHRDGRPKTLRVHRLVLTAFDRLPREGEVTRHLDGNQKNNRASNLRWGTQSENVRDAVAQGTHAATRKTECVKGHPFDATNLRYTTDGHRVCRECERLNHAGWAKSRVTCECGMTVRADSLVKHRTRRAHAQAMTQVGVA